MEDGIWYSQNRRIAPSQVSLFSRTDYNGSNGKLSNSKDGLKATKHKSFVSYARSVFRTSLITSFPLIANTKSQKRRIWKILVFLLCLSGFLYQTLSFLVFYMSYPITSDVEKTSPFEIVQPALTFCSNNLIRRKIYCEKNETMCEFYDDDEENFCRQYVKFCKYNKTSYTGVPSIQDAFSGEFIYNFTWDQIAEDGPQMDVIQNCNKTLNGNSYPCSIRPVPFVTKSGKPTICYTVESLVEHPDSEDDIYPNTFSYEIILRTFPEEYFFHSDPVVILVSVHERKDMMNPYVKGYSLKGGYRYIAHISMTEEIRLPYPFRTNCTDYLSLWRKNNGTGPLNEIMCIEYCKLNKVIARNDCVDKYVSYPHYEQMCKIDIETTTFEIIKECAMECQPACQERKYEVIFDEMEFLSHLCHLKDANCRSSFILLTVSFRKYRVTRRIYQAKYNSIELFSYIGGFMGMWLGLSLVSMFDFVESICYLLYYPMKNQKK